MTVPLSAQSQASIETLQAVLKTRHYPTVLQPLQPGSAYYQLLVGPGRYRCAENAFDDTRQVVMSLLFLNDLLAAQQQPVEARSDYLQIQIQLPIQVPAARTDECLRLLRLLNNFLPLGSLNLTPEGQPYFRYMWKVFERQVDGLVLLEILDLCLFNIEHLGYRIEQLATGQKTLAELMKTPIHFDSKFVG